MSVNAQSKKNPDKTSQRKIYTAVEEMPEPKGGIVKLSGVITQNLKLPNNCSDYQGKIIITFVVEANGKIDDESVVKDPCGKDHVLSNQLISIVKKVKWKPGKMQGKPVAVRYSLPLTICLSGDD